jgi:hypothetical protein
MGKKERKSFPTVTSKQILDQEHKLQVPERKRQPEKDNRAGEEGQNQQESAFRHFKEGAISYGLVSNSAR